MDNPLMEKYRCPHDRTLNQSCVMCEQEAQIEEIRQLQRDAKRLGFKLMPVD